MPRLTPGVRSSTNWVAASWAAASRFGATSVASMDNDTSMASMTVARFLASLVSAVGPASATVSSTSPTSTSAVGRCRHRPGRRGRDLLQQLQVGEPHGVPAGPPLGDQVTDTQRQHDEAEGEPERLGEVHQASPARAAPGEPGEPAAAPVQPRLRDDHEAHARRRSSPGRCAAPGVTRPPGAARQPPRRGARRRPSANAARSCGRGRDLLRPTGFRVEQGDKADVGQFQIAAVEHLDGQQIVPSGQRPQRPFPASPGR